MSFASHGGVLYQNRLTVFVRLLDGWRGKTAKGWGIEPQKSREAVMRQIERCHAHRGVLWCARRMAGMRTGESSHAQRIECRAGVQMVQARQFNLPRKPPNLRFMV